MSSLPVPFYELYLGYAYSMHIASGKDLVVVGLVDVTSTLHTFLVPQIESHLVIGVELPSLLLLG
jgi:hypothetical protein